MSTKSRPQAEVLGTPEFAKRTIGQSTEHVDFALVRFESRGKWGATTQQLPPGALGTHRHM
jgi:hypothetical protein